MSDGRDPRDTAPPPSGSGLLKGRLADVFVPALVGAATGALLRRLGSRATLDDPVHGRASRLPAIEDTLARITRAWHDGAVTHVAGASTTGVDCDVSESVLTFQADEPATPMPIAVVAERRSMREVELRLYYVAPGRGEGRPRGAFLGSGSKPRAPVVVTLLEALRAGNLDAAVATFEEDARIVDARGRVHARADGSLASWLWGLSRADLAPVVPADDGRRCCVEISRSVGHGRALGAMLALERGDSGLFRELRAYGDAD